MTLGTSNSDTTGARREVGSWILPPLTWCVRTAVKGVLLGASLSGAVRGRLMSFGMCGCGLIAGRSLLLFSLNADGLVTGSFAKVPWLVGGVELRAVDVARCLVNRLVFGCANMVKWRKRRNARREKKERATREQGDQALRRFIISRTHPILVLQHILIQYSIVLNPLSYITRFLQWLCLKLAH